MCSPFLLCCLSPQSKVVASKPSKPVSSERGIVYLGHIPFGFFEESMRSFFTQFGDIRALKLSRSKRTARSKGYAFIEFEDLSTARIVAESMQGYMMFGQTLKSHVLDQAKIHEDLFKNVAETFRKMPHQAIHREAVNKQRTVSQEAARLARLTKQENAKRAQMAVLGIQYDFPGYLNDRTAAKLQEAAADTDMAVADNTKAAAAPAAKGAKPAKKDTKADAAKKAEKPTAAPAAAAVAPAPAAAAAPATATKGKRAAPATTSPAPSAKKTKAKK